MASIANDPSHCWNTALNAPAAANSRIVRYTDRRTKKVVIKLKAGPPIPDDCISQEALDEFKKAFTLHQGDEIIVEYQDKDYSFTPPENS
jgi:hypothetical protein